MSIMDEHPQGRYVSCMLLHDCAGLHLLTAVCAAVTANFRYGKAQLFMSVQAGSKQLLVLWTIPGLL